MHLSITYHARLEIIGTKEDNIMEILGSYHSGSRCEEQLANI